MIYKNKKYGKVEDVCVCQFGGGSIAITSGTTFGSKVLMLKTIQLQEIGRPIPTGRTSDDFKPEVIIQFDNKQAFDIFFKYVLAVREEFIKENN